jgi:putative transcriptional regulator
MSFKAIPIDRKALTLMGVLFPNLESLESISQAIGSNMFEGYQPTPRGIEIIRDYCLGKITLDRVVQAVKDKSFD